MKKSFFDLRRLLGAILVFSVACGQSQTEEGVDESPAMSANQALLIDRAADVGIDFLYENGMSGEMYFVEMVGPGGALFDADADGDLDVFLVQGRSFDALEEIAPVGRLYRNDLDPDHPDDLRFVDVTDGSGLAAAQYAMGAAAADYDGDGFVDLYTTGFGPNRLWRNLGPDENGRPRFEDVTAVAGVDDSRWSTSASFFDYDGDDRLDLWIVNYVDSRLANHTRCVGPSGAPDYCGPLSYQPIADRLLRNLGPDAEGVVRFEDVSASIGLPTTPGPGLGAVALDADGDGRLDLYVANDQAGNHLWMNREAGLQEEALLRGASRDRRANVQASMGVIALDPDGDGDEDLFLTHLLNEVNTLYANDGAGFFTDRSMNFALGAPSLGFTGFGVAAFDADGDGIDDLLIANGAVRIVEKQRAAGDPLPLKQPNQLLLRRGDAFVDATADEPALQRMRTSRGVAIGDVDNDGDVDVLITNNSAPAELLFGVGPSVPWLGLRLVAETDDGARIDRLGALVRLRTSPERVARARTDGGYLGANDPRVLFRAVEDGPQSVLVEWPSGRSEVFDGLEISRYHVLTQGRGSAP